MAKTTDKNPLTISGSGSIKFKTLRDWDLEVKDLKIGGLNLPKFSWSWIGYYLAEGVLRMVAGKLFDLVWAKLVDDGPSIQQLLDWQLDQIIEHIDEQLQLQVLRECDDLLLATSRTMFEYNQAPSPDRLSAATNDSQQLVSRLEGLDFIGYRLFMNAASLRLAIIQERAKKTKTEASVFKSAREIYASHHKKIDEQIQRELTLEAVAAPYVKKFASPKMQKKMKPKDILGFITTDPRRDAIVVSRPMFGVPTEDIPRKSIEEIASLFFLADHQEKVQKLHRRMGMPGWANSMPSALDNPTYRAQTRRASKRPHVAVVDWDAFREQVRNSSTAPGQLIVDQWKKSKAI